MHNLTEESDDHSHPEHPMWGGANHQLLRCRGCETVFYKIESWHSEDWDVKFDPESGQDEMFYPKTVSVYPPPEPKSEKPDWTWDLYRKDSVLSQVVHEMYVAKANNLNVLTAIGLRIAFDRATFLLGVDESLDLNKKIEKLVDDGRLGKIEAEHMQVAVNAGNAAAHRGWSPNDEDLAVLLNVLEQFLRRSFFDPPIGQIGAAIPPRPKKKKKGT
ncbi:DUF4145 domain-containing protein [Stenotrophomonas sp. MA5]|uniref:DUF4145 domain-containing protein n=1 Tax=Stenotrophomonas sp. MA5 TaxID=2508572 RepID=UPI001009CCC3|nr:DUF4145 domain-containing protein [Stenotrophomonas sp. MA5]RXK64256.1 DUF4145 domain-containing protein [Stenotrophomonas sp. MA5]